MSDTCLLLVSSELPLNDRRQFEKCERKGVVRGNSNLELVLSASSAFDSAAKDLTDHAIALGANVVTSLQVVHSLTDDSVVVFMFGDAWYAPHVCAEVPAFYKPRVGFA